MGSSASAHASQLHSGGGTGYESSNHSDNNGNGKLSHPHLPGINPHAAGGFPTNEQLLYGTSVGGNYGGYMVDNYGSYMVDNYVGGANGYWDSYTENGVPREITHSQPQHCHQQEQQQQQGKQESPQCSVPHIQGEVGPNGRPRGNIEKVCSFKLPNDRSNDDIQPAFHHNEENEPPRSILRKVSVFRRPNANIGGTTNDDDSKNGNNNDARQSSGLNGDNTASYSSSTAEEAEEPQRALSWRRAPGTAPVVCENKVSVENQPKPHVETAERHRIRTLLVMEVSSHKRAYNTQKSCVEVCKKGRVAKATGASTVVLTPNEIATHEEGSLHLESDELRKVKENFLTGYTTSLICSEGSGLAVRAPFLHSPSWCFINKFLIDTIEEMMKGTQNSSNQVRLACAFAAVKGKTAADLLKKGIQFEKLSVRPSPLFGIRLVGLEYRPIRDSSAFISTLCDVEKNFIESGNPEATYIVFSFVLNKSVMGVTDVDGDVIVSSLQFIWAGESVDNLHSVLNNSNDEPRMLFDEAIFGASHTLSVHLTHLHDSAAAVGFGLQNSLMEANHLAPRYGSTRALMRSLDEAIELADERLSKISNPGEKKSTEMYIENRMTLKKSLDELLDRVRPKEQ